METLSLVLIFLAMFLPSCHTIWATSTTSQLPTVTYEGELVVKDNQTFTIEDKEFNMSGKIVAEDTSTLVIRNSSFIAIPGIDSYAIVMKNRSRLLVDNAVIVFEHPSGFAVEILVQDEAEARIFDSTIQKRGYIRAHNNSTINVSNTTIMVGTTISTYPASGVATFDASAAEIENSKMDGIFVWENSKASINNSVAGIVRTGGEESDKTTVNITNSRIDYIETWGGGAPTIHLENSNVTSASVSLNASAIFAGCSVAEISASGNASVWLLDSSVGKIEAQDNAAVFLGWHLPLFGLVTLPYAWVPILQFSVVIAVFVTVIALVLVFRRKRMKRIQQEKIQTKTAALN